MFSDKKKESKILLITGCARPCIISHFVQTAIFVFKHFVELSGLCFFLENTTGNYSLAFNVDLF